MAQNATFPVGKESTCNAGDIGDMGLIPGSGRLEEEMAIHSSILAWRIPWTEELARLGPAAAKSLQSCPTLCDPMDGSHQAPPSLGFSRQEHWSGLPFPSPMHESEK